MCVCVCVFGALGVTPLPAISSLLLTEGQIKIRNWQGVEVLFPMDMSRRVPRS